MADTKITALAAITTVDPAADVLPIVDISDTSMAASGTTKKITSNQILGAGGTATLASATITGAATAASLTVTGSSIPTNGLYLPTTNTLEFAANSLAQYRIAPLGVFSWYDGAGGTRMTLNSTGLGVGTTDTTNGRLNIRAGTAATGNSAFFSNNDGTYNPYLQIQHSSSGIKLYTNSSYGGDAGNLTIGCGGATNALIVNGSGNVGVGVAPQSWGSAYKAIDINNGSFWAQNSALGTFVSTNVVFDNTNFKYKTNGTAAYYVQASDRSHIWYQAASGTAGNAITFTQAMTLDASGNLVLGSAAVATTATDGFLYVTGCAGTPTGTPTAKTGRVPIVVDTTNNKLYFYSGGSWVAAN